MWIDLLFLLALVMAVLKGLRQGLIIAVFSGIAFVIGLAAAIKLSAAVANRLSQGLHVTTRWLPVIAFVLVFLAVLLVIRWGAKLAEKVVDLALMGWLNKFGGILLYAALYTMLLSILLFYAMETHLLSPASVNSSLTYPFIRPWGPAVINAFGKLVPFFKDMFVQLEDFFGHLSKGHPAK
jgi:membrane protein required for colicin V production